MESHLLIADDNEALARSLKRFYERRLSRSVTLAHSVADALALIEGDTPWSGALLDFQFPDGDGLALLEAFRRRSTAPALMLTATNDPNLINRVLALNASFAVKPADNEVLEAFARRLAAADPPSDVVHAVTALVREQPLTDADLRVLIAIVDDTPRDELLPEQLANAEETISALVQSLVRKCGKQHLADVVREVWDRAARRQIDS
ncbi:MAG: response regulator [Polyangiales bacterium]